MENTRNSDANVAAFAARFPLLFDDLRQHLQAVGRQVQARAGIVSPVEFRAGRNDYVVYAPNGRFVLRRLQRLPAHRRLVQMFHAPAQLLQFLTDFDLSACLADERWLPWLMLPLAQARHVQHFCESNPARDWPWPLGQHVVRDGPAAASAERCAGELQGLLGHLQSQLLERLERRYADRPSPGQVLRAGERPLRVLAAAGRGSCYMRYCARDISDALRGNGVDARYFLFDATPAQGYEILQKIAALDPDTLFLNGQGRTTLTTLPRGLPVLSWDQDYCLVPSSAYADGRQPHDHLLLMLSEWQPEAAANGVPADHITHVNPGTNLRLYHPATTPPEPDCDVLFVGNYFPFEEYRKVIGFEGIDPGSQQILLHARERLKEWALTRDESEPFVIPDFDEFLPAVLAEFGLASAMEPVQWRQVKNYFRYRLAHELLREMFVTSLTEFDLRVYGRNWEQVPAIARCAHPPIENGPELCAAIQRARINLHIHIWSVHHPRLYDSAAAGGFVLAGRLPEVYPLTEAFDPQTEIDTFGSIAELKSKIRFYLAHPERRVEMARRAAARAAREHSMTGRMARVLEVLRAHDQPQEPTAERREPVAAAVSE